MAKKYMKIPCKRVLYKIKAKGIEEGRALDVGTGPGIFPLFIVKAYPKIQFTCIDLSPTMVTLARENATEFGLAGLIDFQVGSAYHLHRDTSRVCLWFFNLLWKWVITRNGLGSESFMESVRSSYSASECRNFLEQSSIKKWVIYTRSLEMWIESP